MKRIYFLDVCVIIVCMIIGIFGSQWFGEKTFQCPRCNGTIEHSQYIIESTYPKIYCDSCAYWIPYQTIKDGFLYKIDTNFMNEDRQHFRKIDVDSIDCDSIPIEETCPD